MEAVMFLSVNYHPHTLVDDVVMVFTLNLRSCINHLSHSSSNNALTVSPIIMDPEGVVTLNTLTDLSFLGDVLCERRLLCYGAMYSLKPIGCLVLKTVVVLSCVVSL